VDIGVYCVQAGRWSGDADFAAGEVAVPQSIKKELRKGTSQGKVWAEVSRSNQSLGFSDSTDSMELSLKSKPVARKLREVRRRIVPEVPTGSVGFIFAYRGRAVGGEFFGTSDLALALLPKLVDSYAADLVLQHKGKRVPHTAVDIDVARGFLRRIRRAGSRHTKTLGSGAGIQTRAAGLVGDGVSIRRATVHYGCQVEERIVPAVKPTPRNRQRGSGFLE
jgi:hypothetical protein